MSGHGCEDRKPVAIVGVAAELPSGDYASINLDYAQFTQFLLEGRESYTCVPRERFNIDSWKGNAFGRVSATHGSFLKNIDQFDHGEFGISVKDARAMSLSTRKLVELSFLALLDSGIDYRGRDVGCYAAATNHDILSIAEPDVFEAQGSFGGIPCMVANKISYHLDLQGPSVPIDTACSSTLTATHLAVQALRTGDCESAVVAGCQLNLRLADYIQYSQGSVLSADGKCKPFDAHADGFSRGEGAVVIVLKLLDDALRDGDYVYGNILGTGLSSSGSKGPVYAPVASAQIDAMRRAYRGIGRNPREVDFVEMHATGTAAGDPTEGNWVGDCFQRDDKLLVGSVKGNIGHLEITAFLASLCKVCGMFQTVILPPNVNLTTLNPAIHWDKYKLEVPLEQTPLRPQSASGKLLVSLCSSGIGGANGHAVLESHSPITKYSPDVSSEKRPTLIIAAGLSPKSVHRIAQDIVGMLRDDCDHWPAISHIYGRRARQMTWRSFAVMDPLDNLHSVEFPKPTLSPREKVPIVFVFSGQGPQHISMGRQLFARYKVFRETIQELDGYYRDATGSSLLEETGLFCDRAPSRALQDAWPIAIVLPSLAMLQIALFDLLSSLGLRPDIVMGHSAGETALMYASGAASKRMAIEVAVVRGQALSVVEQAGGTMAAVSCAPFQAEAIIRASKEAAGEDGILEIACYNAPEAVTIAGQAVLVEQAVTTATARGIAARRIQTNTAVHCALMDVCQAVYCHSMAEVFRRHGGRYIPLTPTYSTATGGRLTQFTDDYLWSSSRGPVQFGQTIRSVIRAQPDALFVEISPHPVLSLYIQELGAHPTSVLCPMRRSRDYSNFTEERRLLDALGRIVVSGYNGIDFRVLNDVPLVDHSIKTPPYPLERKFVPYLPQDSKLLRLQLGPLVRPLSGDGLRLSQTTHPDLAQHVINGEPIMPAAGFLEMALEAGARVIRNVQFHAMLSLAGSTPTPTELVVEGEHWRVISRIPTSDYLEETDAVVSKLHAEGFLMHDVVGMPHGDRVNVSDLLGRCNLEDAQGIYEGFEYFAQYGPTFRRIRRCYFGLNEALVEVQGLDDGMDGNYIIPPAILDACIHVVVHPRFTASADRNVYYLPSALGSLVLHKKDPEFRGSVYAHAILKEWLPDELICDVQIISTDGEGLCTFRDLKVARHLSKPLMPVTRRFELVQQPFAATSVPLECPLDVLKPKCAMKPRTNTEGFVGEQRGIVLPDSKNITQLHNISDRHPHELEELVRRCNTYIDHIEAAGKRVICVLGLDFGSGMLHEYCSSLLRQTRCSPTTVVYHAGYSEMGIASQGPPHSCKAVKIDTCGNADASTTQQTFDIILGVHLFSSGTQPTPGLIQSITRLLLPGGLLLTQETRETSVRSGGQCSTSSPATDRMLSATSSRYDHWRDTLLQKEFKTSVRETPAAAHTIILEVQSPGLSLQPPQACVDTVSPSMPVTVLSYSVGKEMAIQSALKSHDPNEPICIWLKAREGCDGDAARGFTRALRREFPLWDLGLLIVTPELSTTQVENLIRLLASTPGMEREVLIDENRQLLVRRLCESPMCELPPPTLGYSPSQVPPMHIRLSLISSFCAAPGRHGAVGRVIEASEECSKTLLGATVVTVTRNVPEEGMTVHEDAVVPMPEALKPTTVAMVAPGCLIAGAVLGLDVLCGSRQEHAGPSRIVVIGTDSVLGRTLLWFFQLLGLTVTGLESTATVSQYNALKIHSGDTVVAGDDGAAQVASTFLQGGSHILRWDVDRFAHATLDDPRLVGQILKSALGFLPPTVPFNDQADGAQRTARLDVLFKANETYLLVGGIGSLGLHIALWMYQRGARRIILTSRSGRKSLERAGDVLGQRILQYLESQQDLSLRLESSDAASSAALERTLSTVEGRVAGCMLLSGILSDRGFFSQDSSSFEAVFRPKLHALETLESVLAVQELDFLVAFSSIASFGNAGQTNYSSANTALEGRIAKHKNAFAIVAPAIVDTVSISSTLTSNHGDSQFEHLMSWAFSGAELCNYLEDGIRRLAVGSVGLYVPDLDWGLVYRHLGPLPLYNHLVGPTSSSEPVESRGPSPEELLSIVQQYVDVPKDELSTDVPLSQYGIDSLSAGRLSFALRPFLSVSSMQLLGGLTVEDLFGRIRTDRSNASRKLTNGMFDWNQLNQPGQTILKLVDRPGDVPLIFIHGANGNPVSFMSLQQRFTTSLWAIQTTPDTPFQSIEAMAQHYYEAIKIARPEGPYRVGAFSGTSLILFFVARRIVAGGDQIAQFCLLDHFPLLFLSPSLAPDSTTIEQRTPGQSMMDRVLQSMLALYRSEPSPDRRRLADEFEQAAKGHPVSPQATLRWRTFSSIVTGTYEFILELWPHGTPYSQDNLYRVFAEWLAGVDASLTLFIASRGIKVGVQESLVNDRDRWEEFGVRDVYPDASVVTIEGTHFSFLDTDELAHHLQRGWNGV